MRFKIDLASLIVGRKFIILLCFTLHLRAISKYKPPGAAYIWRGDLTEGFLRYEFGRLIFGGAYFRNFTVRTFFTIVPPTFCYQSCANGAFITPQIPFFF